MAQLIQFEEHAVARLREQLGAAEATNQDLIAFARGHSGAVASIHEAVLAAIAATSFEKVVEVVTREWPSILGIDSVVLALISGGRGLRAHSDAIDPIDPELLKRMIRHAAPVEMRSVRQGHPLFGADRAQVRAEAIVAVEYGPFPSTGLLALGDRDELALDSGHGSELLLFLGRVLGTVLRR